MRIFFDTLISLGVLLTAYPAVVLLYSSLKRKNSWERRHKKISRILASILLLGTLMIVWGSFIEPHLLIINRQTIDIDDLDEPITIAFVADYQIGLYKQTAWVKKSVDKILKINPDIVFIGGDNVDNGLFEEKFLEYLAPLGQLAKKIPTYAVHGNHEYGIGGGKAPYDQRYRHANVSKETKEAMEKLGITYLTNELKKIQIRNQQLYIFGGDSYWARRLDFSALEQREKSIPTIGLVHNPSFIIFDAHPANVDLWLSGHTHGGQIRLPFIGPLGIIDSVLPKKYYQGLHPLEIDNTYLFVTSGIGETGTRARLFNPPEIALITLQ